MQVIKSRPTLQQHLSVRLSQAQVEELNRLAASAGCLRSDLVRQALRLGLVTLRALDEQESKP